MPSSSSAASRGQRGVGAIVARFRRKVFHIAYKFTGKHDDAEDLTQEIFLKVFKSLDKFNRDADFSTWLSQRRPQLLHRPLPGQQARARGGGGGPGGVRPGAGLLGQQPAARAGGPRPPQLPAARPRLAAREAARGRGAARPAGAQLPGDGGPAATCPRGRSRAASTADARSCRGCSCGRSSPTAGGAHGRGGAGATRGGEVDAAGGGEQAATCRSCGSRRPSSPIPRCPPSSPRCGSWWRAARASWCVDLQAVSYMDSASIGCLMDIHRLLQEQEGVLKLSGACSRGWRP